MPITCFVDSFAKFEGVENDEFKPHHVLFEKNYSAINENINLRLKSDGF